MPLFDVRNRSHTGPADHAKPTFQWLNCSAEDDVARIRTTFEEWFEHYPEQDRSDLRARFRSSDDAQHEAAAFELLLHEVLRQHGCRIQVHPKTKSGQSGRPDFLAEPPVGEPFYLEATLVTGKSEEERAAERRKAEVYDLLDELDSENFWLRVRSKGEPESSPPTTRMREFLEEKMQELDPDEIRERYEAGELFEELPQWEFELRGWHVEFQPIPKSPEARGGGHRTLGSWGPKEAKMVQPGIPVREGILKKVGAYGELDLPFVVAVNATSPYGEWRSFEDALFGDLVTVVPAYGDGTVGTARPDRKGNGVWNRGDRAGATRLSAVLGCLRLMPWSPTKAPVRVYHNPWADRPLIGQLERLPAARIAGNGTLEVSDGTTLGEFVGLPAEWPRGEG